ncbi:MAG: LLM class flavin-dependent oxidoreductase [Xanthobacteraceae bacterium]|nr:LLM class flavin-dependent oxidoreductase [Xanthobacteraceae bacterium]MBX3533939.1 LLM class flavin-dependent oxidoreductase [Xanthobacteraceae bacterium]MCW5674785.1 LLM class flavin-dependent oxidoreductase [Xanthobacteraceae bacterium]MCW5677134.1 LLM class flavin-dependent oxidoreductase [Xanthobacteraceae bacterium]
MIPFSVLDLAPVVEGGTAADAFRNSLDLARHAEVLGYKRYWLAEHHNMPGIASAATSVVIGHIASGTKTIRVGAGGVMLPNHSPLVIAEQFGTLASLYGDRIDLGLGRAPGTDQLTMRALRRNKTDEDTFPDDVVELAHYFMAPQAGQRVHAYPGAGLNVPLWILGSSAYGAQLAALLGLPYAFASHFAPDYLMTAIDLYRKNFRPSQFLEKPYFMPCIGLFAAATDDEARMIFTSQQRQFVNLRRGNPGLLQPPASLEQYWSPAEKAGVEHALQYAVVGSPETVRAKLKQFIEMTAADEVMLAAQIYDHGARKRSYEIAAQVRDDLAKA